MPKYKVYLEARVSTSIEVEAEDCQCAYEDAVSRAPSLSLGGSGFYFHQEGEWELPDDGVTNPYSYVKLVDE